MDLVVTSLDIHIEYRNNMKNKILLLAAVFVAVPLMLFTLTTREYAYSDQKKPCYNLIPPSSSAISQYRLNDTSKNVGTDTGLDQAMGSSQTTNSNIAQNQNLTGDNLNQDPPQPNGSVRGVDVSGHNGPGQDWATVKNSGYEFAFVKSTEGLYYASSCYKNQYHNAHKAGLTVGTYHFANPYKGKDANGKDIDNGSGADQANFVLDHSNPVKGRKTTAIVLDLEKDAYVQNHPSAPDGCYRVDQNGTHRPLIDWVEDFVKTITQKTGRAPIIYTNPDFWNSCIAGDLNDNDNAIFEKSPLWIAHWTSQPQPDSIVPWNGNYTFWQYTSSGKVDGITDPNDPNSSVDISYGYGIH